jgi:hypothetical protein
MSLHCWPPAAVPGRHLTMISSPRQVARRPAAAAAIRALAGPSGAEW